jgi:uncharacterized protein
MPIIPSIGSYNTPGVYVTESTFGAYPAVLNTHDAAYFIGTGAKSGAPTNTLTFHNSLADFTNVYGTSPSAAGIQLFLDQRSGYGFYFCNVALRVDRTVTVTVFAPATVLTLTIDGYVVNYTCVTGDTAITARDALGNLVNTLLPLYASYYTDGTLRYNQGLTVTASANVTLGTASTITTAKPKDVADAVNIAFPPEIRQGFVGAGEFYQSFTTQTDQTFLQLTLEALASDPDNYFVAVNDCKLATATLNTNGGAVNAAIAERATFTSPRGHSWYYFPYLKNATSTLIPASFAVIGAALRSVRTRGFAQPAAGVNIPLYGVTDVSFSVDKTVQGQLNPLGINCIRKLPRGQGICIWGARTLSTSKFYTFGNSRVTLNVLAGTLRVSYDDLIFSLNDGTGAIFSRAKQTAAGICDLLRTAGALYGASPAESYLVICDLTNNSPDSIESGRLNIDVLVKTSATVEVVAISMNKTSLSTVLAEIVTSGDLSTVSNLVTTSGTSPAA